jgi:hypothetical protein
MDVLDRLTYNINRGIFCRRIWAVTLLTRAGCACWAPLAGFLQYLLQRRIQCTSVAVRLGDVLCYDGNVLLVAA